MLIKSGKVTRIRSSVQVSGHSENGQSGTSQMVVLKLDDSAVRIKSRDLPAIDVGDNVAVSGRLKGGTIEAFAYHNLSNGSYSDNGGVGMSVLSGALAIVAGFTSILSIHSWIATIPFLLFTLTGGLTVRHGLILRKTKRKLKQMRNS